MTTRRKLVRTGRQWGEDPVTVVTRLGGVAIELGINAINCTIHLTHTEASRMAEFILAEQQILEVEPPRERGKHEVQKLR